MKNFRSGKYFLSSLQDKATEKSTNFLLLFFHVFYQTDNGLKSTPKILDDIFASLVQNRAITDLPKKPQGLTIKPTIMGFDTPHYWLCDNRLLCLQDPNNESNWNVFRECWKQGQVSSFPCFFHLQFMCFVLQLKHSYNHCSDKQH